MLRHISLCFILCGLLSACAPKPNINIPLTPPPVHHHFNKRPRVVLVLGAGGSRGYAHLGVLQALEDAHIPVDVVIGASAGSIVSALYADTGNVATVKHIMMPAGFWDYADMQNLFSAGGIIRGYQLEDFLLAHMRARYFSQLKKDLIVATTDVKTGRTYAIESGPIAPAVLASAAIPGVIKPVQLYGHFLIDGGMVDPVPVDLAKKLHPKIIIAVNLSKLTDNKIPTTATGTFEMGITVMWERLSIESMRGADVVINPDVGDINIFDLSKKQQMYEAGLKATRREIPRIRQLLAS